MILLISTKETRVLFQLHLLQIFLRIKELILLLIFSKNSILKWWGMLISFQANYNEEHFNASASVFIHIMVASGWELDRQIQNCGDVWIIYKSKIKFWNAFKFFERANRYFKLISYIYIYILNYIVL